MCEFNVHTAAPDVAGSVKDMIEGCGVPHTAVDLILANGRSVEFSYRIRDMDRISVFPVFESFDISSITRLRPQPLRELRFVLDGHLAPLTRHLRLLGFDSLHDPTWPGHQLVEISTDEHRCLLTRDIGLLEHSSITRGYYLRATEPRRQLTEIVQRFHLAGLGAVHQVPGLQRTDRRGDERQGGRPVAERNP